jgi:hypothetical protein
MKTNSNLEFRKIKSLNFLYEVNENGTIFRNVKSKKQNKIKLDFHHSKKGYYVTFCKIKGKTIRVMIHSVVAECWLGDKPNKLEVDHIDRNTHNNHYTNLRYVTKSEQMKNRDHTNISKTGSKNLEEARRLRMKPVKITKGNFEKTFESIAETSRYLSNILGGKPENYRYRLKRRSKYIEGYDIIYLNAETKHDCSTEQEIVHESDLTGNYKTAFNLGKQAEVLERHRHGRGKEIE